MNLAQETQKTSHHSPWISTTDFFIFTLAVVLRLIALYLSRHGGDPLHADGYFEIAYNIAHGNGYSFVTAPPYFLDSSRTPGLPFLLAPFLLIPRGAWVFIMLQIVIGSVLPVMTRHILIQAGISSRIATGVSIVGVLDPVGILLSIKILTETFYTFFFLLFFLLLQRFITLQREPDPTKIPVRITLAAGFALGIATLFRPASLYLPILALGFIFLKQLRTYRGRVLFLSFLCTFLICVLPWSYRNWRIFGVPSFSSIKETVLYVELAPSVLATQQHTDMKTASKNFFLAQGFSEQPYISAAEAKKFKHEALKAIQPYPGALAQVALLNMTSFLTHDGALDLIGNMGSDAHVNALQKIKPLLSHPSITSAEQVILILIQTPALLLALVFRFFWIVLACLLLWGIFYRWYRKKFDILSVACLVLIAYFLLTTISNGYAVNARFRFPINTVLLVFVIQTYMLARTPSLQKNLTKSV